MDGRVPLGGLCRGRGTITFKRDREGVYGARFNLTDYTFQPGLLTLAETLGSEAASRAV